uniref:Major facilitator superfamily (MFS) profile domain-containing protein n=1 Tax=Bionectria ochroleuca TaxID=29856 RepID=A0A8H7TNM5_BIOOC
MPNASKKLAEAKSRSQVTGYDVTALKYCVKHFGGRLLATSGTWFCNDVFFYGNKLFQGQFIKVISNNPDSLMTTWSWNLVNITVSLVGYYLAALLIDNKFYGRKMMQQVGFFMCFLMFVIPAFRYKYYTSPEGIHSFQAMYFISSFFNQFGPNSVTFLVAGEVFPTPVRATAHGFSACIGKSGALLASVLYAYIDDQTKFYVVPWFGLAGMLLTWLFLPDTTGLDLKEQERRWTTLLLENLRSTTVLLSTLITSVSGRDGWVMRSHTIPSSTGKPRLRTCVPSGSVSRLSADPRRRAMLTTECPRMENSLKKSTTTSCAQHRLRAEMEVSCLKRLSSRQSSPLENGLSLSYKYSPLHIIVLPTC